MTTNNEKQNKKMYNSEKVISQLILQIGQT